MLILEYMRKYCFLEKVSVSPRHVQSSVSLWNTVNFQYSTITMGDKHRRIFYRANFPESVRESWSYALRNKIFFSFPQFLSTAAMTHTIYMGFLCISLVLVLLCEASAKKGIREETQKEKKVHLKDIFSGRMKRYENIVEPSFKDNQESKHR